MRLLLVMIILSAACSHRATRYTAFNGTDGYLDSQLAPNKFSVTFHIRRGTPLGWASSFATQRANERCQEMGQVAKVESLLHGKRSATVQYSCESAETNQPIPSQSPAAN